MIPLVMLVYYGKKIGEKKFVGHALNDKKSLFILFFSNRPNPGAKYATGT